MRIGLGPVFAFEWLTTARNWRVYGLRVLFGLGLLLILWMTALSLEDSRPPGARGQGMTIREQAEAGRGFSAAIVATQLTLMLLIAPAATASTLCLDKARGTLAHVLTTDLSDSEIVLGKLAARLMPPLSLVFGSIGLMSISTLMGGVDPMGLSGAMLVTLGVTVLAATLALTISVWAGKTHEVVMASYLILAAWLASYPFWLLLSFMGLGIARPPEWLQYGHPYWLALDVRPGQVPLHRHAWFLLACVGVSAAMAALAVFRVRSVAIRQINRPAGARRASWWRRKKQGAGSAREDAKAAPRRRRFRLLPSPSLDGNPVLWREWHRAQPSRWTRGIWWTYALASIGFTVFGFYLIATGGPNRNAAEVTMIVINGFQVALGLLLMSVSAATSLAEERVRGSLDVLLTTTLPTRSIVWGKWWAAFRRMSVLAILPGILGLAAAYYVEPHRLRTGAVLPMDWTRWFGPALLVGLTLSYGAAITSFGLVMATWIARLDRAVTATVSMYLALTIGEPILVGFLIRGDNPAGPGLMGSSPFMGIAYTGAMMIERFSPIQSRWGPQIAWATFWILANLTFAALLMKLELSRFNVKLGRTPEEGIPARPAPPLVVRTKEEAVLV